MNERSQFETMPSYMFQPLVSTSEKNRVKRNLMKSFDGFDKELSVSQTRKQYRRSKAKQKPSLTLTNISSLSLTSHRYNRVTNWLVSQQDPVMDGKRYVKREHSFFQLKIHSPSESPRRSDPVLIHEDESKLPDYVHQDKEEFSASFLEETYYNEHHSMSISEILNHVSGSLCSGNVSRERYQCRDVGGYQVDDWRLDSQQWTQGGKLQFGGNFKIFDEEQNWGENKGSFDMFSGEENIGERRGKLSPYFV